MVADEIKGLVSMPHAALWMVQPRSSQSNARTTLCFNAARGFVGGATASTSSPSILAFGFNAARGFVGGAASS